MSWRLEFAPEVERDITIAADWYETRQSGLGAQFVEEVIRTWEALTDNPLLSCRRHSSKNIRWRYLDRFPYRIVYEVDEMSYVVKVAAVSHAARHDKHWQKRI